MPRQPRTTSERAWPSGNLTHLLPKMPPQPGPWTAGRNVLCDGESPIDTSFKAVLLDSEMRVLLGTNPRGEWELLGGRAEAQDATPQDTVRREVREEAGIDITVGAIIDTWFYDIPDTGRVAVTSYLARPVDDVSPVLGTEHADLAFFHARELDDINLPEGYRHSIRLGIDQLQATWGK
ncbi:NUDIX hydrolase [Streptomyces sp. NPDC006476]|uniref:NUDIX hydrolase n=1 Tax=Streptomyces sp. NPDC006476 TaxID=3157175 RepID=UPI0033A8549C